MARITRRGLNSSESEVPTNCSVIERARLIWVMLKDFMLKDVTLKDVILNNVMLNDFMLQDVL